MAKALCSQCRVAWVQSLVRELDPPCYNKTQCSQINNFFFFKKKNKQPNPPASCMAVTPLWVPASASEGSCRTPLHFPDFLLDLHPRTWQRTEKGMCGSQWVARGRTEQTRSTNGSLKQQAEPHHFSPPCLPFQPPGFLQGEDGSLLGSLELPPQLSGPQSPPLGNR